MNRPSVFSDMKLDLAKPAGGRPATGETLGREPVRADKPAEKGAERDIVKTSTYLPREVHDILREIAFHERNKVHDLLLEGIEHVLKARRHPSITELKARHAGKAP